MTPRPPAGARSTSPIVIKRYANRRLYNSRTGQYVSRKTLVEMARRGEEFVVEDTTTGEDITHAVLGQIIVAQEAVQKQPLLPSEFMRRLLTFYGDTLRTLLGCYLDFSLLTISNESMRRRMAEAGSSALKLVDEQVQQNIKFVESMLLNTVTSRPAGNSNEPTEHVAFCNLESGWDVICAHFNQHTHNNLRKSGFLNESAAEAHRSQPSLKLRSYAPASV